MDAATARILPYLADSALRAFLSLYHDAAVGQKGVFVVGSVIPQVERPAKGAKHPPLRLRLFLPGNIEAMGNCATELCETANVYFGTALMPLSLRPGSRGKEDDIVAVLALVLDEDADKDELVTLPPGIEPSFIMETSAAPATNRQVHFVYDKPLVRAEAAELAKLALRKCGGDHGGGDVTHVWRLPETLNHPDWKKIEERGRPREAQSVRLVGGSRRVVDVAELRRAPENMPDLMPRTAPKEGSGADWQDGGDTDRAMILGRLSRKLRAAIFAEGEDRSRHAFATMLSLFEAGLTDAEALIVATEAPFARKYAERGDLTGEIVRVRAAWIAKGSKIKAGPPRQADHAAVGDVDAGGEPTQDSVALAFAKEFQGKLRYCHTSEHWYFWTGTHWQLDETQAAFGWAATRSPRSKRKWRPRAS